jgi:hypothetical protein
MTETMTNTINNFRKTHIDETAALVIASTTISVFANSSAWESACFIFFSVLLIAACPKKKNKKNASLVLLLLVSAPARSLSFFTDDCCKVNGALMCCIFCLLMVVSLSEDEARRRAGVLVDYVCFFWCSGWDFCFSCVHGEPRAALGGLDTSKHVEVEAVI